MYVCDDNLNTPDHIYQSLVQEFSLDNYYASGSQHPSLLFLDDGQNPLHMADTTLHNPHTGKLSLHLQKHIFWLGISVLFSEQVLDVEHYIALH